VNPRLLVNDRAARGLNDVPAGFQALNRADFDTPENRMGSFQYGRAWESCMILSPHADHGGWSYRPDGVTRSLTETLRLLSSAACGDGNMLLNLAPLPDGSIRPEEEAILRGIAPWMRKHAPAIHGTRGGPWVNGSWGGSTHRGSVVYVHVFEPGDSPLQLRALPQRVVAATLLGGAPAPFQQTDRAVSLTIPREGRDPHVTIVKLTLAEPVAGPLDGPALAEAAEDDPPGTLVFAPAAARLDGGLRAQERHGVASIGYWTNPEGSATWDVGISSPGTYQIRLSLSNPEPGAKLRLEIGGRSFIVEVPDTDDHDSYRTAEAGAVTFRNAERTTLRVTVADKGAWRASNIRHVKLVPSNR
jgi:hypothetical protein